MLTLYIGADNLIVYQDMEDSADGSAVNDATVTMTLKNAAGTAVENASDLTLSYAGSVNGHREYQGVIPATISLTNRAKYSLEITAASSGRDDFRKIECVALYRGET